MYPSHRDCTFPVVDTLMAINDSRRCSLKDLGAKQPPWTSTSARYRPGSQTTGPPPPPAIDLGAKRLDGPPPPPLPCCCSWCLKSPVKPRLTGRSARALLTAGIHSCHVEGGDGLWTLPGFPLNGLDGGSHLGDKGGKEEVKGGV